MAILSCMDRHYKASLSAFALGSRLETDDIMWTQGFKLTFGETLSFDFPPSLDGENERGTVIHISRPKDPQRDWNKEV